MKLYNTLTRHIDDIKPIQQPTVSVYTCGPTVYDYAHIGHWFNYIRMDMLIRTLKASGYMPTWVMNITDVGHLVSDADEGEDKLEKGARREGKTAWDIARFYTEDFLECMKLLDMVQPDHIVKATDHITEQIALIEILEGKGYTYVIDDGVYFDTSRFPGYAAFARLDLNDQQVGARITVNKQKRKSSDFALWKFSPTDRTRDMEWDSPWGKGFPGWHIECSAMSMKYLGETIDIHTGGIDHIPVHHTNEIAQSEAATERRFANHWMHSNHVMVNGEKVSKSLGNGIRLQDIVDRGFSPRVVRLHVLESHYRSQSKFSWESLEAARNRLHTYYDMAALRWQAQEHATNDNNLNLAEVSDDILSYLQDDLDTPSALAKLSEISASINDNLISADGINDVATFEAMLQKLDDLFGLGLMEVKDLNSAQKELLAQRHVAREQKLWQQSDDLREVLAKQGIAVRDVAVGQIWSWINP
ncbi:MAG: cysteine--tRNA ligase [Candidatus Saccharimonadales bacterium]